MLWLEKMFVSIKEWVDIGAFSRGATMRMKDVLGIKDVPKITPPIADLILWLQLSRSIDRFLIQPSQITEIRDIGVTGILS